MAGGWLLDRMHDVLGCTLAREFAEDAASEEVVPAAVPSLTALRLRYVTATSATPD